MSIYKDDIRPLDLDEVKTYPLASRPSKVTVEDFAKPIGEDSSLKDFLDALPDILAVRSLRELAAHLRRARDLQKPIIWGIGGHVIKTGMSPSISPGKTWEGAFGSYVAGFAAVFALDAAFDLGLADVELARLAVVVGEAVGAQPALGVGLLGGAADEPAQRYRRRHGGHGEGSRRGPGWDGHAHVPARQRRSRIPGPRGGTDRGQHPFAVGA